MNKAFYLILFFFIVTSCTKDELLNESFAPIKESRALKNVMSNLNIKPETLKELNISERFYQKAITEINETNILSNKCCHAPHIYM